LTRTLFNSTAGPVMPHSRLASAATCGVILIYVPAE
jgi:hypothetical protein